MPPELSLLIVTTEENLASDLQALIAKNFRSRLATATSPSEINQKVYAIDPDILLLGQNILREVAQNPRQFKIGDDPFYRGRYVIALGTIPDEVDLEEDRCVEIPLDSDRETFLSEIEEAAETMGFMTDRGNVENRLVQRELSVSIDVDGNIMEGRTTGLDLEGCGVRVRSLEGEVDEGTVCRVTLEEADLQGFVPARGVIEQLDESWEEGYEAYLQIEFSGEGFPSNDLAREIIQDLIDRQEDESISYQRDD